MASETITILLVSNASKEALKIAASMDRMNGSMKRTTKESTKQQISFAGLIASYLGLNKAVDKNTKETNENSAAKMGNALAATRVWAANKYLGRSSHTAGLNVGMLSVRIHEWLIPALGMAASAMVPVVAGLVAIGATALTAAAGLIGVMGMGLAAWNQEMKGGKRLDMQANWAFSGNDQFGDIVMEGIVDALDNPAIRSKMDKAVAWTKDIFHNILPQALISFVKNVDMGAIGMIVKLFSDWLPNAMGDLAHWGSQLTNIFGAQALGMVNSAIKTLAGAITEFSRWMASGGSKDVTDFLWILVDILGLIGRMGMATLPVLNNFLNAIYPYPLKPIANTLIGLMNTLEKSPKAMKAVERLAQVMLTIFVGNKVIGGFYKLFEVINMITGALAGKKLLTFGALNKAITAVVKTVVGKLLISILSGLLGLIVMEKLGISDYIKSLGEDFKESVSTELYNTFVAVLSPFILAGYELLRLIGKIPGVDGMSEEQYEKSKASVISVASDRWLGSNGKNMEEGMYGITRNPATASINVTMDDDLNLEAILEDKIRDGKRGNRSRITQGM